MEAVAVRFADAVNALGLSYQAVFVPFSASRHAKPNPKVADLQLNWQVSVGKGSNTLCTPYSKGIGHIPGYKMKWGGGMTLDERSLVVRACELGVVPEKIYFWREVKIKPPTCAEVMESLVLDAGALDSPSYEDWAGDYGYGADSRSGEAIYRECLMIGLKLRSMIGYAKLRDLREAVQEL